jgi:hypothetical protein
MTLISGDIHYAGSKERHAGEWSAGNGFWSDCRMHHSQQ